MNDREILLQSADKIHTTKMGIDRIKNNLGLSHECDPVEFCSKIILNKKCEIIRKGKNFYCTSNDIIVTVNAHSYTIITAHKNKGRK
ncbi:MAG: DUF3781 domain-containing protein [Oscillospiraceae bacterium]|nr:DUF3781 domain-containing protein [Oscillospiraceae bacterium]